MIYCTRKLVRNKSGVQNFIESRSLKNYSVDVFESALKDLDFPNYETFTDIDAAYSDFIDKITKVIDNIPWVPSPTYVGSGGTVKCLFRACVRLSFVLIF